MSAQQGGTNDREVVKSFKEALKQRIGADHFRMWFTHGVSVSVASSESDEPAARDTNQRESQRLNLLVQVRGRFALDRLQKKFIREIRAAAAAGCGANTGVTLQLDARAPVQAELPLGHPHDRDDHESADADELIDDERPTPTEGPATTARSVPRRGLTSELVGTVESPVARQRKRRAGRPKPKAVSATQLELPQLASSVAGEPRPGTSVDASARRPQNEMTAESFVVGSCNKLAHTAMLMAMQEPGSASPLFFCGPTGTGKTHLLAAIADQFRRRHRMRRVVHLSAEQFTNDFISSVGNSGIASFRRRYREVDALLVDDVQFLGAKRATLREMLYTVETLIAARRPLIFTGNQSPTEISGLTRELAGRMASGLLCPIQTLDRVTRETLLRRALTERCKIEVPDDVVTTINSVLAGDGRVVSGMANLINTLQRMLDRMPTMDEIRQFGGDLLRAAKPVTNLTSIEQAVCEAFHLPDAALRSPSQSRSLSEPRMLAMHLSRQMTSAAYADIGAHYGGRSHSTAIAAGKNVNHWLKVGKSIGRGHAAMTVQEAIDRVESRLRSG